MGRGTKLWILYASIGLICYSYSLSSNTVYVCEFTKPPPPAAC